MSKQKKTAADKIGNTTNTRPERWEKHTRAYLDKIKGSPCFIPAEWLEEIEGRPLTEVITDYLINSRGWNNPHPTAEQKYRAEEDADYEEEGTRRRNAHEAEIIRQEVYLRLCPFAHIIDRAALHDFISRFYRAGDRTLDNAIKRAVSSAMSWERSAEAADERMTA